jgi:hypothetical protein
MDTNLLWTTTKGVLNYAQAGSLAPSEWNTFAAMAVQRFYNDCLNEFEKTQNITDLLSPFKTQVYGQPLTGIFDKPVDYMRFSSISVTRGKYQQQEKIVMCTDGQWAEASRSTIVPPERRPIANEQNDHFRFLPADLKIYLTYLKKPTYPVYGFTRSDGVPVYNPLTSTDTEFTELALPDLVHRICLYAGFNLERNDVMQYMAAASNQPSIVQG